MRAPKQMLDQLSDAAPAASPGLAAQSSDLEESIRHLNREELGAYASGQLTPARLSYCQAHLDSCEECREELEDLRTFKSESAYPPPVPNRGVLGRRRGLTLPLAAAIAIVFVAAVSTVLWVRHETPRANKTPVAATVAPAPSPAPPAPVRVAERAPTPPETPQVKPGFALLAPVGQVISDTRPEFSWQPLAGALHYSVAIVDTRLHPVEHSHALQTTVWRPRRPLHHGRTYLWQVTATLPGGHKVVAAAPGVLIESDNGPHHSR